MMATVPKLWPGSTIVCIGGGPSLTPADVDYCRGKARVIAINDAYRLAPWADVLYASDVAWWKKHNGVMTFAGLKYGAIAPATNPWHVQALRNDGPSGLCLNPNGLRVGGNSGYQAINLAVHLGAARILLLGYDMSREGKNGKGRSHWFGEHPKGLAGNSPYVAWLGQFPTLVAPLKQLGVVVINCTRRTVLTTFPQRPLEVALPALEAELALAREEYEAAQ